MNEILDENEAAQLLDCEPSTVRERARTRELPAVKIGKSWRFPRTALIEHLNSLAMANLHKPADKPPKAMLMPAPAKAPRRPPSLVAG